MESGGLEQQELEAQIDALKLIAGASEDASTRIIAFHKVVRASPAAA